MLCHVHLEHAEFPADLPLLLDLHWYVRTVPRERECRHSQAAARAAFGGVFLCVFACFMINFYIATATTAILGALVIYIHTTARETNWGDVSQAILFHQVRKFLLRLDVRKEHIKHWRPSLLLFAKNPTDIRSIVLGNHIKKGGLYLIGHVLLGSLEEQGTQSQEARNAWLRLIHLLKVKGFPQLVLTPSFRLGLQNLLLVRAAAGAAQPLETTNSRLAAPRSREAWESCDPIP